MFSVSSSDRIKKIIHKSKSSSTVQVPKAHTLAQFFWENILNQDIR